MQMMTTTPARPRRPHSPRYTIFCTPRRARRPQRCPKSTATTPENRKSRDPRNLPGARARGQRDRTRVARLYLHRPGGRPLRHDLHLPELRDSLRVHGEDAADRRPRAGRPHLARAPRALGALRPLPRASPRRRHRLPQAPPRNPRPLPGQALHRPPGRPHPP